MLRARLATAAVAIPLLLLLILYPATSTPVAILVFAVGVIGIAEYASLAFAAQRAEWVLTVLLGTMTLAAAVFKADHWLSAALTLAISAALVWVLFTRPDFEQGLRDIGLAFVGILYISILLPHFVWLRDQSPLGPRWVVLVLAIGMAGDAGGYFVGKALGRHKLSPHVSPGKTIEGALGIVAASLLIASIYKLLFLHEVGMQEILYLSLVMSVLGQLGDLSESVMKRAFGAKESGWIFPGHGGVLDRIDSLLFPVAFLYYHLVFLR